MIVTGFLLLPIDAHSIEVLKSSKHVHSMRSNLRFSLKRWWWKCVQVCGDNFSTSPVISSPSPWWVQRSQVQQAEQVPSGANFIWCWLMIVGGYTALSVLEIMIMNHNSSTGHYPSTGNPWKSSKTQELLTDMVSSAISSTFGKPFAGLWGYNFQLGIGKNPQLMLGCGSEHKNLCIIGFIRIPMHEMAELIRIAASFHRERHLGCELPCFFQLVQNFLAFCSRPVHCIR